MRGTTRDQGFFGASHAVLAGDPPCRRAHHLYSQQPRDHSVTSVHHVAVRAQRRLAWIFPPRGPL
eukprot:COSAG06_NODE_402_length_16190_cov_18.069045_6_plen_65_part_00